MGKHLKLKDKELEDFKYLYGDNYEAHRNNRKELKDEMDIDELNNLNLGKVSFTEFNIDKKVDLDKEDLDNLDSEGFVETFDEELWIEMNKKEVPDKELYTKAEREIVASENMALINYVINKITTPGTVYYEDLFGIGLVGYTKALNTFDKSKKIRFSTYAIKCIKNEIYHNLRKENKHAKNNIYLDTVVSMDKNGNNLTIGDSLSKEQGLADSFKTLEDLMLEEENKKILLSAIKKLKEEEQFILIYRFGLDNGIVKTQKEIAELINMSQANVSKIQKSSMDKLKLILKKEMFDFN